MMISPSLTTIACVLMTLLSMTVGMSMDKNNYAAARCCSMGLRCTSMDAMKSEVCKTGHWMSAQPKDCQAAACLYCKANSSRRKLRVCLRPPILKNCFNRQGPFPKLPSPSPKAMKSPMPPSPGRCTAPGVIVIPASKFPTPSLWQRTTDKSGIIWNPSAKSGIDPAGSGAFCLNFVPNMSGLQYFTILSSAPHPTEHNDAWFRFPGGVTLYRPETKSKFTAGGSEWLKGYENLGGNKIADYILHKDHDGHQFVMNYKMKGSKATVCVSGRSSKFTIFKLVIITCPPGSDKDISLCSRYSSFITNKMNSLPPNCK